MFNQSLFLNKRKKFDCRNIGYKKWMSSIAICFGLIGAGIVAGVIVLALIPIYLPIKNLGIKYMCEYSFCY